MAKLREWAGRQLPPGSRLYVFDGCATGHGHLSAGTPVPSGSPDGYDVGGCMVNAVQCGPSKVHVVGERQPKPLDLNGTSADGRAIPSAGCAGGWQELVLLSTP